MKTQTLDTAEADIVYDVEGPLPTADGRPPLFLIGQPMDATGFRACLFARDQRPFTCSVTFHPCV